MWGKKLTLEDMMRAYVEANALITTLSRKGRRLDYSVEITEASVEVIIDSVKNYIEYELERNTSLRDIIRILKDSLEEKLLIHNAAKTVTYEYRRNQADIARSQAMVKLVQADLTEHPLFIQIVEATSALEVKELMDSIRRSQEWQAAHDWKRVAAMEARQRAKELTI